MLEWTNTTYRMNNNIHYPTQSRKLPHVHNNFKIFKFIPFLYLLKLIDGITLYQYPLKNLVKPSLVLRALIFFLDFSIICQQHNLWRANRNTIFIAIVTENPWLVITVVGCLQPIDFKNMLNNHTNDSILSFIKTSEPNITFIVWWFIPTKGAQNMCIYSYDMSCQTPPNLQIMCNPPTFACHAKRTNQTIVHIKLKCIVKVILILATPIKYLNNEFAPPPSNLLYSIYASM